MSCLKFIVGLPVSWLLFSIGAVFGWFMDNTFNIFWIDSTLHRVYNAFMVSSLNVQEWGMENQNHSHWPWKPAEITVDLED